MAEAHPPLLEVMRVLLLAAGRELLHPQKVGGQPLVFARRALAVLRTWAQGPRA